MTEDKIMFYEEGRKSCTFTGHRLERLNVSEDVVKEWLEKQIRKAVSDGYVDFIAGMQRGVDLWAAEIVIKLKAEGAPIRFIGACAFKGMENRWEDPWKKTYYYIQKKADAIHYVANIPGRKAFFARNEWMVDRASRLIAVYNGVPGGTKQTIDYAKRHGLEVVSMR